MEPFRQLGNRQTDRQTDRWTDRASSLVAIATENLMQISNNSFTNH